MYEIDKNVRESVAFALRSKKPYKKVYPNTAIIAETEGQMRRINVVLFMNDIFGYEKTGRNVRYFVNNCGWPTKTTQERINDALTGVKAKYRVYVSKGRQMIRNIKTGEWAILGDGQLFNDKFDTLEWHKKNAK